MIDNLVAFATTWDGGMKRRWIMYDIHAITAEDLELLAQERAAELSTELNKWTPQQASVAILRFTAQQVS